MDPATLMAGIAWEFATFPEYLDLVRRRGTLLNFTAYVGHSAVRLYVMGDAAYERPATPDEIERMCGARARGARGGRGRVLHELLVRAPGRRRQARAEPVRRRGRSRGALPGRGRRGQGRDPHHAGRAVHLRRRLRVAAAGRSPVHLPVVRGAGGKASRARAAARGRSGARRERVAAGDAPAAHDAVHDGRRVQPQHRPGLRRTDEGEPRGAPRRVPRSDVARRGRGRSRGIADEAALGDVRGLRVGAFPRAGGPAGERPRARARMQPARRDVRDRGRRRPHDALSRRTSRTTTSATSAASSCTTTSRSASPTRVRTSINCATRRSPPTCSAPGCAIATWCRSSTRCAS